MSDKTELLSPERLEEIQEDSAVALYWIGGQRYPTDDMASRAVNAVPELLADRDVFRQQVAAELTGLRDLTALSDSELLAAITALATRLGIELPA